MTLEALEQNIWPPLDSGEGSFLISTCHALHKKPLEDFTIEDLRIMIGQNIGLQYLIPIAIDVLRSDILAEGDFYKGDLLKSVLTSDADYWRKEPANRAHVCTLFEENRKMLEQFETTRDIRKGWMDAFEAFGRTSP